MTWLVRINDFVFTPRTVRMNGVNTDPQSRMSTPGIPDVIFNVPYDDDQFQRLAFFAAYGLPLQQFGVRLGLSVPLEIPTHRYVHWYVDSAVEIGRPKPFTRRQRRRIRHTPDAPLPHTMSIFLYGTRK